MNIGPQLKAIVLSIREVFSRSAEKAGGLAVSATKIGAQRTFNGLAAAKRTLVVLGLFSAACYWLYQHPPITNVGRGEIGVRTNLITGSISEWREGGVFVFSGIHDMRTFSLRDQSYRPDEISRADGPSPLQSVEGLSLGVDLAVRYALDATKLQSVASRLPDNIGAEIVQPAVNGVIYKIFARHTVRDIFSTKRSEIQQTVEAELKNKLAADGIILRSVVIGKIDLPADYRRGMDALLAEELATEKMRYTLDFKDKRVKEIALDGEAEKVHREKAAEAAAREQIIAAKAQEEAMKHVLPFKQRQIEQRQLEAEADKVTRIRGAEANAQSPRIEAEGEAHARQKLTDADVYRLEKVGKANAEQMEREGALLTRHPLLVQKSMADKLSDKIQVIIAPPSNDGGFIGAALLGGKAPVASPAPQAAVESE